MARLREPSVSRFRVIRFFRRGSAASSRSHPAPLAQAPRRARVDHAERGRRAAARRRAAGSGPPSAGSDRRVRVRTARRPAMQPMEPTQPTQPVLPIREPRPRRTSRLRLARDTIGAALILGGLIVVFANFMPPGPPDSSVLDATATPKASPRVVAPLSPTPVSASPVPTRRHRPTSGRRPRRRRHSCRPRRARPRDRRAGPSRLPADAAPTQAPAPTPRPTPKPTKKPTPTPVPAATISISRLIRPDCGQPGCGIAFTYTNATTYTISFSDGAEVTQPLNGWHGAVPAHSFLDPGTYAAVVVVDGPGVQTPHPLR